MAFSTQFRRVLAAAFLVLILAAAAGAFAVGFTGALTHSLSDPASAPALRLTALARLDERLGYGGFLKTYREYLLTGSSVQRRDLQRISDDVETFLEAFRSASVSEADRDQAAALRSAAAPFRRAALFGAGAAEDAQGQAANPDTGLPSLSDLELAYAVMKATIFKAADTANLDRIRRLSDSFVWAQGMSVAVLWLLALVLFALAWFLHDRVIAPMDRLRSSINGAAAGARNETVWGIDRGDELGGIARAAERLRQSILSSASTGAMVSGLERSAEETDRLAEGAERLEGDLARVAGIAMKAQACIEAASTRATKASQDAIQAASLACEGSVRFAERAEQTLELASAQTNAVLGALAGAVSRLSDAAIKIEAASAAQIAGDPAPARSGAQVTPLPQEGPRLTAPGQSSDTIVDDLVADLEALERFARERKDIAGDKAVAMTATLVEAIDRLNAVADRISASADDAPYRAAAG
jgi:HAMP domain-containing protein